MIENMVEARLYKAKWLFPRYLLAINLVVLPTALGGLLYSFLYRLFMKQGFTQCPMI